MLAQSAVGRLKQVIKAPVATPGWIWMDASLCLHWYNPTLSLSLCLFLSSFRWRGHVFSSFLLSLLPRQRQRVTLLLLASPSPSYYNIHLSSRALNAPLRKCSFFARQSFGWEVIRRLLPPAGKKRVARLRERERERGRKGEKRRMRSNDEASSISRETIEDGPL